MTSRVLSTFFFVSLVSLVAAVDPADLKLQTTDRTEDVKFSVLNPAPKDITSNRKMQTDQFLLSSPMSRQKRQARSSTSTLKWVRMRSGNSLPSGAVYIYNTYGKRYDYVCKCGCQAGYYGRGTLCRYPGVAKVVTCSQFEILVNKDNFEVLEWTSSSNGKVPQNSVKTCSNQDIYVGKNVYGLGKVQVRHKHFFLPWYGTLYKYASYQVLTFNKKISREHISDVKYNIKAAKITGYSPKIMVKSSIVNNQWIPFMKTITFSKKYQEEKRWGTSIAITAGVRASITAGIPFFSSAGFKVSAVTTKQCSSGSTMMMSKTLSMKEDVPVPEEHSCIVSLWGHRYRVKVPFTARLSRTYRNGVTRRTSISGMYSGVNVAGFSAVVDRCDPLSDAQH
ncbi:natterin-3-like [Thunnus albacares]|uniref:natterin-3-like n=1 Tax=Thunnus albacares TaxID=8236 RepID=UPI001CF69F45|nr:natterin-3-like [Thunnus albacares]